MNVLRRTVLASVAPMLLVASCMSAQIPLVPEAVKPSSGVKAPDFDVSSVKQNKSGSQMMRIMTKQDGFSCDNIPLKTLIGYAYGIKQDLISGGPGWVDSVGFDVQAKVAGTDVEVLKKMTGVERAAMLQPLLAERFKLVLHREMKVLPNYEMVAAKGGVKLKESAPIDKEVEDAKSPDQQRHDGMSTTQPGGYTGEGVTLDSLAGNLSYVVHRTVVDKTGLKAMYNIELKWKPEEESGGADDGTKQEEASIFTALQEQLGLKLVSSKGPEDTLVIDHAEMPVVN